VVPVASGSASASSMRTTPSWRRPDSAYAYPRCAAVTSKKFRTSATRHTSTACSSGGDGLRDGAPAEASVSVDEIAAIIHLAGDPEDLLTLCHRFRELVNVSAVGNI